jgi:hypothetical protein
MFRIAIVGDAGIVDQDVETPLPCDATLDEPRRRLRIFHVRLKVVDT